MCPPEGLEDTPLLQIKQIGQFWGKNGKMVQERLKKIHSKL
jgi:hypothetical protein